MVSLDAEEFIVWPGATESNSETLVAVDNSSSNNIMLADVAVCTSVPSPTPTSGSVNSSTASQNISGGNIAGISTGAVTGMGLIVA